MKVTKHDNYLILEDEKDLPEAFALFLEYIIPKEFNHDNLVIDLVKYNFLTLPELLSFLNLSNLHRSKKKSFVIINAAIDPDSIPEELIVVPTLQEAEDIIEMEEIEKDLGF